MTEAANATPLETTTSDEELELAAVLAKHKIPTEALDAVRAKFDELYVLVDAPVVFKLPSADQIDRMTAAKDRERNKAVRDLASFLVVYPPAPEYAALTKKRTMLYSTIMEAALALAANKPTVEAKKL